MAAHFEQIIARRIHLGPQLGEIDTDQLAGALAKLSLYNFVPRSCLIVGDLNQLTDSNLVNTDQLRSFELFRGNTWRPEIITFDELLERAQFIVEHGAGELSGITPSEV